MPITINVISPYIANMLLLLLCYDVLSWVAALIKHAVWMHKHIDQEERKCMRITHTLLLISSALSGAQVLVINLSWLYFKVYYGYHIGLFIIIAGVDIMMIHQYALIARCTGLEKTYWPYLSNAMTVCMISPCRWIAKKHNIFEAN